MPRAFADILRRVEKGYNLPTSRALELVGRPVFTISLDNLLDIEASDVFVLRPAFGVAESGAVALQFSTVQLFNPARSGVVLVLEQIVSSSPAVIVHGLGEHNTAIGGTNDTLDFRDQRIDGAPAAELRTASFAALQFINSLELITEINVSLFSPRLDVIIAEGQGFAVAGATVETAVRANFLWREETV